jgi:hypothetical protein
MSYRPTASKLIEARAECQRCPWSGDAKNAQALAAKHFDKTGHRVIVTIKNQVIYGAVTGKVRDSGQGSML